MDRVSLCTYRDSFVVNTEVQGITRATISRLSRKRKSSGHGSMESQLSLTFPIMVFSLDNKTPENISIS